MENQALTAKADDRRDRDLIKQLRRDLDESRRKAQDVVQELNELRRDRDSLKLDKNEQFLQHQKEIEELKNKNQVFDVLSHHNDDILHWLAMGRITKFVS